MINTCGIYAWKVDRTICKLSAIYMAEDSIPWQGGLTHIRLDRTIIYTIVRHASGKKKVFSFSIKFEPHTLQRRQILKKTKVYKDRRKRHRKQYREPEYVCFRNSSPHRIHIIDRVFKPRFSFYYTFRFLISYFKIDLTHIVFWVSLWASPCRGIVLLCRIKYIKFKRDVLSYWF